MTCLTTAPSCLLFYPRLALSVWSWYIRNNNNCLRRHNCTCFATNDKVQGVWKKFYSAFIYPASVHFTTSSGAEPWFGNSWLRRLPFLCWHLPWNINRSEQKVLDNKTTGVFWHYFILFTQCLNKLVITVQNMGVWTWLSCIFLLCSWSLSLSLKPWRILTVIKIAWKRLLISVWCER